MNIPKGDIRVLVVDDSPLYIEGLIVKLGELGYTGIQQAEDGPKALELAKDYRPHLVLIDTQMPGPRGYEVCRQMRQEPYGGNVAIIGMSNYYNDNDPEIRGAWMEAGADDVFPKNIELTDLNLDGLILAALEKHHHQQ